MKILVGMNGFTYRAVQELPKVEVKADITEFVRKANLVRLHSGKKTFLDNKLTIKK